jgi:TldD protein
MEDGEWLIDLLLREGAEYVDVRYQKSIDFALVFKNGSPEPPEHGESFGASVRVLYDGSMSFAATNNISRPSLREMGLKALKTAKAMKSTSKEVLLSNEETNVQNWGVDFSIDPTEIDTTDVIELLRNVDNHVLEVRTVSFPNRLLVIGGSMEEKTFLNSDGSKLFSKIPRIDGYFIITAYEAGKGTLQRTIQLGETGGWERISVMDPASAAKEEAEAMSRMLLKGQPVIPGIYDIVVGGEVTGIISHEACGHPQEADRILGREAAQAGESYVKQDMIGRKIGSSLVNISDFPALLNSNGFYLYDDEGVKATKKELIKSGVINEFLHGRDTAYDLGVRSNAAMRASSYAREPIVRMSNTYTEVGDYTQEELFEDVRHGLYVKSFQEWNIDDLRWNNRYVGLEAYLVENGKLGEPVKAPVIEATTGVLFSSIDAIGDDLIFKAATCGKGQPEQGIPVWTGGPSMRMRKLFIKSR